ncbi:MlaD family protein [Nocardia bovistercoris]|uniref:MCE family protein n=1 Tax=Nocardia bovistercoris TaxID=2785916 RepID=A0A931N3M6_9NOCA|nr:MlaD family protein [Nocardia bovistercoris]MBH0776708.1 MCE family protein [Nocardia bovistercoris]
MPREMSPRAVISRFAGSDVLLGGAVVAVAAIVLAGAVLLYVRPPGRVGVVFETTDAASIGVGAEVRVAGITVGRVSELSLGARAVRVRADIDEATFVGDRSRVEVRMLTPVGGYAVTLVSLGDRPLGTEVIPADRVVVPYSIGDVLQAAPTVTDKVDGATVERNIDQIATALRHNPESVGSMIDGMRSVAAVLDRQRTQVATVAGLAAEYLRTFDGSRDFVFDLVRRVDIMLSTYNTVHAGFNEAYRLLGDVLHRIEPLERFYLGHKAEVVAAATELRSALAQFDSELGPVVDRLQEMRGIFAQWLTPRGLAEIGAGALSVPELCVPVPGRTC